jgi:hypothetical protein
LAAAFAQVNLARVSSARPLSEGAALAVAAAAANDLSLRKYINRNKHSVLIFRVRDHVTSASLACAHVQMKRSRIGRISSDRMEQSINELIWAAIFYSTPR